MPSPRSGLYQLVDACLIALLVMFGLVAVLLTGGTTFGLTILPTLAIGVVTSFLIVLWVRSREYASVSGIEPGEWKLIVGILLVGVALRVSWFLAIHPQLWSDFEIYYKSALHLLQSGEYRVPEKEGLLIAYRPPGTAFLLASAMRLVGANAWAPVLFNLVCFYAAGWLLWLAVRPKVTKIAGATAVGLLALWPSDLMFTSLPQSESPTLLGFALLIYLLAQRQGRLLRWAISTGILTGLLCLVRNSNLILIPLWILVVLREPIGLSRQFRLAAVIVLATFLPILPWTYRNYRLLGSPVLVATNGGENLFSANNDAATGSWTHSVTEVRAYLPDELAMNEVAKRRAIEWIRTHPVQFVKLAVMKLRIFLSQTDEGPYATLQRGIGYTGPGLIAARVLAALWWLVLWALVLTAVRYRRVWALDTDAYAIVALAVVPSLLFLIFQSQPRYHMQMAAPLIAIAAYGLSTRRKKAGVPTDVDSQKPHTARLAEPWQA